MEEINDIFERELLRYYAEGGDDALRYNYPLNKDSIVFDLGGYKGDFSYIINKKFGCNCFLFEPLDSYFSECVKRFSNNPKILPFKYGIKKRTEKVKIYPNDDGTSTNIVGEKYETVYTKGLLEVIKQLDIDKIDLIKINIEGDEYDVLEQAILDNSIHKISNIQVQYHQWIDNCEERRNEITKRLEETHSLEWKYDWVWESWKIK